MCCPLFRNNMELMTKSVIWRRYMHGWNSFHKKCTVMNCSRRLPPVVPSYGHIQAINGLIKGLEQIWSGNGQNNFFLLRIFYRIRLHIYQLHWYFQQPKLLSATHFLSFFLTSTNKRIKKFLWRTESKFSKKKKNKQINGNRS